MFCKFNKYIKISSRIGTNYCSYQFDINKHKYQNSTLRLNILLGNTEECNCSECNPDTRYNVYENLRTNFK